MSKTLKMPSWLFTALCILTGYGLMLIVGLWVWLGNGKLELT